MILSPERPDTPAPPTGGSGPDGVLGQITDLLAAHPTVAAGAVVALILAIALLVSWWRGKVESWIVAVSWIAAFGFSAEGMWYVATDKADVPGVVAVGVFAVFELFQIRSMLAARRHYQKTIKRGGDGKVTKAGDPGGHGVAVWGIAAIMGLIVALAAKNAADAVLRLAIPVGAAWLWWNDLTDDGVERERGSWRWTPRRIGLALGLLEPGERDIETVHREARIKQMTDLEFARRNSRWGWLAGRRSAKLARLSLTADPAMIAAVRRKVRQADWFLRDEPEPVPADAQALTRMVRDQIRTAQDRVADRAREKGLHLAPFPLATGRELAPVVANGKAPAWRPSGGVDGAAVAARVAKDVTPEVAEPVAETPATSCATDTANPSATESASAPPPAAPQPRQKARRKKADDDATKQVARLLKRNPNITAKDVAERTGMSERTASRRLAEVRKNITPKEAP